MTGRTPSFRPGLTAAPPPLRLCSRSIEQSTHASFLSYTLAASLSPDANQMFPNPVLNKPVLTLSLFSVPSVPEPAPSAVEGW